MRPYEDITDPRLAKALAHPIRTRVLTALDGRTASPSDLASELEVSLGVLSYHVRRLNALGFIKLVKRVPRRGAVEHYYTATARPRISESAWGAMPSIVRDATVGAALEQIGSAVVDAAGNRGFDAADSHLSRTPVTVDKEGWDTLADELGTLQKRIRQIEDESRRRLRATSDGDGARRDGDGAHRDGDGAHRDGHGAQWDGDGARGVHGGAEASVVLMLFQSTPPDADGRDGTSRPSSRKRRTAARA